MQNKFRTYYVVAVGIRFKKGVRLYDQMKIEKKFSHILDAVNYFEYCSSPAARYPLAVFTGDWQLLFCSEEIFYLFQKNRAKPYSLAKNFAFCNLE